MQIEAVLKNKIAGNLVSLMLQDAGNIVINYGTEGIPDHLMQFGFSRGQKVGSILSETPHFVVLNKKTKHVDFLRIRYMSKSGSGRSLSKEERHWPDTQMIVVRPLAPYFFVPTYTNNNLMLIPLKRADFFGIGVERLERFGVLVKKFLR